MSRLVGAAKARELYFLSERVEAKAAKYLGLTNCVVAPKDLKARATEIAPKLVRGPTMAFNYMK